MDIVDKLRDHTEPPLDSRGNPMYRVCYDAADEILRLKKIEAAAKNLVAQKGRHHTELAYQRLAALVVPNA